jgi:hypothetical protein
MTTPEFSFLLKCSTSSPDVACIKKLAEQGVDWRIILDLAQQQGVRPLLRHSLKGACWDIVPEITKMELEKFHRENAERCLFIAQELVRLFDAFQNNNIRLATFKGVALAATVYGDLSLRELCDLDLLVPESDLSAAETLLKHSGYEAVVADQNYRSAFLRYQGQYLFRLGQTGMLVDLHWELASKGFTFPLRSQDIWRKLATWSIAGRSIPTLSPEDNALFLAAHGTKEGWRFLTWVVDFAEFLRKHPEVDWLSLLRQAERSHCARPLLLAVLLSSELLDAPAPPILLEFAQNHSGVRALSDKAKERILHPEPSGELDDFLDALTTHDRWRDRIRPVFALLTTRTASDFKTMPLPKPLWNVYYLTRPFRLATKLSQRMYSGRSPQ